MSDRSGSVSGGGGCQVSAYVIDGLGPSNKGGPSGSYRSDLTPLRGRSDSTTAPIRRGESARCRSGAPELAVISDYGLGSDKLYRADDFPPDLQISKKDTVLYGFFSPSMDYSKQYLAGGGKGNYGGMMVVTLSKPIGNILVELIKIKDAFTQNAGQIKSVLAKHTQTQSDQKRVKSTRAHLSGKDYQRIIPGKERNNVPNAVMIKSEPLGSGSVANIEITTRLKDVSEDKNGKLLEHPFDKYVTSIDRIGPF